MNIDHLIRAGRVTPMLETDANGIEMLTGWVRTDHSRKRGAWTLDHPQPWIVHGELTPGPKIVLAERKRQIQMEGYDSAHDDAHTGGELGRAAQCYEREPSQRKMRRVTPEEFKHPENHSSLIEVPESWPWHPMWWKPGDRIRELAKAGALYLAESERLKRAGEKDKAADVEKQALGCAVGIDNLYKVTPMSPGPHIVGR